MLKHHRDNPDGFDKAYYRRSLAETMLSIIKEGFNTVLRRDACHAQDVRHWREFAIRTRLAKRHEGVYFGDNEGMRNRVQNDHLVMIETTSVPSHFYRYA